MSFLVFIHVRFYSQSVTGLITLRENHVQDENKHSWLLYYERAVLNCLHNVLSFHFLLYIYFFIIRRTKFLYLYCLNYFVAENKATVAQLYVREFLKDIMGVLLFSKLIMANMYYHGDDKRPWDTYVI